jgi:DNA-binding MarR family transcriptional regulator
MPAERDHPAEPATPPAAPGHSGVDDLTWLAYRAAEALGQAFNKVSREAGLADLRDWLVLALISGDGTQRTQLEIATQLGIDKSTLVPLLDRLERDGLIVRTISKRDRRVRIPRATPAGVEIVTKVAIARDTAINDRLAAIPPSERASFHATLWNIVESTAPEKRAADTRQTPSRKPSRPQDPGKARRPSAPRTPPTARHDH